MRIVSWFSAGVSSAVATKIAVDEHGCREVIYIDIDDAHPDSDRFVSECESWIGLPIQRVKSPYGSVDAVLKSQRFINGPRGAPCTKILKRRVRQEWEAEQDGRITYVWGFDLNERHRALSIVDFMPNYEHLFPLIEKGLTKENVHCILERAEIKRPTMYDLGFPNNNCVGCVKGGMGYWNLIRKHFPDVFEQRAERERDIGASCIKGVPLDELSIDAGRNKPVVPECGIFCEGIE